MYTYQDYMAIGGDEKKKQKFMLTLMESHKSSKQYETAKVAQDYYAHMNRTIMEYQKLLYTISGQAVPDNFSANYKLASNFFQRFVRQQVQYLLGNGVTLPDNVKKKLGPDFDTQIQKICLYSLIDGMALGYWNDGKIEPLRITEFAPLYDEESGALMAGIRFWQLDTGKPIRGTIYELDGYTEILWKSGEPIVLQPKRGYVKNFTRNVDGRILDVSWENYPGFPIVPMWGNENKQSEIVGIREQIDAYDLIKSGFANDLDDCSQIFWTIQNAGGMDDVDLVSFIRHMRTVKAAVMDDVGARAESHTIEVPYNAREALLTRLRSDLYDDYMALDTKIISGGAVTATQIQAAYEPINSKADMFEYQVKDFLKRLGNIVGLDLNDATFTRSAIVNGQEALQQLILAAQFLSKDYVTRKILELLGDGDKADDVLNEIAEDEAAQFAAMGGTMDDGSGGA